MPFHEKIGGREESDADGGVAADVGLRCEELPHEGPQRLDVGRLEVRVDGGGVGPPLQHHEAVLLVPLEQLVHPAPGLLSSRLDGWLEDLAELLRVLHLFELNNDPDSVSGHLPRVSLYFPQFATAPC